MVFSLSKEQFSRDQLKWIAMVTMVLDHVGCIFVPVKTMPVCYYLLRGIGRVSFPLICFLLVQGFFYTHSRRKYLFRLWCFALVSEIPYDLAFFGRVWNPWNQNVFVTLAIGLMMLLGLFRTKEYVGKGWRIPISCGIVGAAMVAAVLCRSDYSFWGVLMILAFYVGQYDWRLLIYSILLLCVGQGWLEAFGAVALFFVRYYAADRDAGRTRLPRSFFYWFYPVHLLILYGIFVLL
ncbi:MAG TPA: hypothetical protein DIV56_06410 [Lachnospiraceae bacterium]|nr:hypothetical protein [Lachnospiraceae bacterium]